MTDPKPGPAHAAFARALVETCRRHGMDSLNATYCGGFKTPAKDEFRGEVRITWSEGRHGDPGRIAVRFEGTMSFPEIKEPHP